MQRQEIRSLADLAGEGSRVLTTLVRDMPEGFGAVACRVHSSVRERVLIGVVNLADRAGSVGVNRQTAYRWFRDGTLPVPAEQVGRPIVVRTAAAASASASDSAAGVVVYALTRSHLGARRFAEITRLA